MVIYAMICILHLQNFRYDYIRIFYRKNTTCQKIIGGAKPPRAPPLPTALFLMHNLYEQVRDTILDNLTIFIFSVKSKPVDVSFVYIILFSVRLYS